MYDSHTPVEEEVDAFLLEKYGPPPPPPIPSKGTIVLPNDNFDFKSILRSVEEALPQGFHHSLFPSPRLYLHFYV